MAATASVFHRAALLPRTITAVVGGAVLLLAAWAGGTWWIGVAVLLAGLASTEYVRLQPNLAGPMRVIVVLAAAAAVLVAVLLGNANMFFVVLGAIVVALGVAPWLAARMDPYRFVPGPFAAAALGIAYLGLPHGVLARWRLERPFADLAWMFVIVWAGDIAAYFVGLTFGRHKMAPKVSPGKSWEGAVAGLIAGALAGMLAAAAFGVPAISGLLLGVVISIAAQIGDLFESAMKRSAGVKDSGGLLPGHGGVLDRFDAVLFAAPVAYAALNVLGR
ncbi:MAG: phosphatidate cytidylyltransferase [Armatimonadetes bacterium]|nr:phosphatidate cytidylyltransferase [Armatimonadota bacterium]MBI2973130.1 phosphatidate cytidylyltransferase [Armatimonadota bacterium]